MTPPHSTPSDQTRAFGARCVNLFLDPGGRGHRLGHHFLCNRSGGFAALFHEKKQQFYIKKFKIMIRYKYNLVSPIKRGEVFWGLGVGNWDDWANGWAMVINPPPSLVLGKNFSHIRSGSFAALFLNENQISEIFKFSSNF